MSEATPTVSHSLPRCNPTPIICPTITPLHVSRRAFAHLTGDHARADFTTRAGVLHATLQPAISGYRIADTAPFRPGRLLPPGSGLSRGRDCRQREHEHRALRGWSGRQGAAVATGDRRGDCEPAAPGAPSRPGTTDEFGHRCGQSRTVIDDLEMRVGSASRSPYAHRPRAVFDGVGNQVSECLGEPQPSVVTRRLRFGHFVPRRGGRGRERHDQVSSRSPAWTPAKGPRRVASRARQ
jgi:hypothetical protein